MSQLFKDYPASRGVVTAVRLTKDNLTEVARYMRTEGNPESAAVARDDHIRFYEDLHSHVYADIGDWIVKVTRDGGAGFCAQTHEAFCRSRARGEEAANDE